jgi:opacity protein-like surface antigen
MKMKNTSLLTLLLAVVTLSAKAQTNNNSNDSTRYRHHREGGFSLQIGYREKNNLGQLNQALGINGIPSLAENNIWFGLAFNHVYHDKIITELGLGFIAPSRSKVNDLKVTYNQGEVFYRIGYNIAKTDNYRLYPFAGISLAHARLKIKDNAAINSVNDFSDQILNQSSSKTIHQSNFGWQLGLGYDYLVTLKSVQKGMHTFKRTLPIGLRAGYAFQGNPSDWKIDNHSLSNGPAQKNNSLFVSLSIGLGYSVKK